MDHLAYNIKIIRGLMNLNQTDFGELMKVSLSMQKSYEGGRAKPDSLYIQRLSQLTQVREEDITNKKLLEKDIKVKVEFDQNVSHDQAGATPAVISTDAELIRILKKHNDFLERIVETNLTAIVTTQQVILAEVKAGLKWEARKAAGSNKKKEIEVLATINSFVGEYLTAGGVKSTVDGGGS